MSNNYNPFKENRTEQMRDLWKYYVPFPGLDDSAKPLVVEGGRGSGKTMYFQCNSWRQKWLQLKKDGKTIDDLFDEQSFVGIYYRVDTTFVSSMRNCNDVDWSSIFETYFSICILQEILDLLLVASENALLSDSQITTFVTKFSRKFCPESSAKTLVDFRGETENYLDSIEDKLNELTSQTTKFRLVNAHRIITDMCVQCSQLLNKTLLFKIFIDEYETLQEYQQKIINTLIKHSTLPVIFNIGLRPRGMKTTETISSTETIEAPHDYELQTLGIGDDDSYPEILKEICQKRIRLGKEMQKIPQYASEDIGFYLGTYSMEEELRRIEQVSALPHINKLKKLITELGQKEELSSDQIDSYIRLLCTDAPILNSRLHYALLCKKTAYSPNLSTLAEAYSSNSSRYKDWMHNRKFALIFLLCKETKKEKLYYGFNVFSALSSNIVRYFLELCEQTFRIEFLSDYKWETPIPPEIQSEAARYVSEYKVLDIAGYEPYGHELRVFIQYLGQIFYRLHTEEDTTLGEPEPNHFSTKDLSIPAEDKKILNSAVMWNVLQIGEPTKKKQSKLSPETVDFYINKIYVPYFGISYRNQRKIQIDVDTLSLLLGGDEVKAKKAFLRYFKKDDPPVSSEVESPSTLQMDLFEENGAV